MVFNKNSTRQANANGEDWRGKYATLVGFSCVALLLVGLNNLLEPKIPPEISDEFLPSLKLGGHGDALASNITRKPVQIIRPTRSKGTRSSVSAPKRPARKDSAKKSDFSFDPNGVAQSNPAINTQAGSQAGISSGSTAGSSNSSQSSTSFSSQSSSQAGTQADTQAGSQAGSQASSSAH